MTLLWIYADAMSMHGIGLDGADESGGGIWSNGIRKDRFDLNGINVIGLTEENRIGSIQKDRSGLAGSEG